MADSAVDNDILIKLSAYRLIEEAVHLLDDIGIIWVLGAARFVVPKTLAKDRRVQDRAGAMKAWDAALPSITLLEPTADEISLAAAIEEAASHHALPLDAGESQLFAVSASRGIDRLITGDKRAVAGAERLAALVTSIAPLAGRVACLEQVVRELVTLLGNEPVRIAVCSERAMDRAISACMSCASVGDGSAFDPAGLESYIKSLRADAPTLLADDLMPRAS